ncbi:hypothetical protein JW948_03345, partial [bacterium]|nr:hypothetical protein [bacterium]
KWTWYQKMGNFPCKSLFFGLTIFYLGQQWLVLKPELGMQLKAFTEKFTYDAEWKPSRSTRWRFVITGIFIEIIFLFILIFYWVRK